MESLPSVCSQLTFQFLTDLILHLFLPDLSLAGVRAVAPVTACLDVSSPWVSLGAAPQLVLLVVFSGAGRVPSPTEGEGKLAGSAVLRGAERPPGPGGLRDTAEPGQVGEKVGVNPRPAVPGSTLALTEADDAQQDEVVVEPLGHQAATRVSTAGVRNSLAAGVNQCSLRAQLVTVKLPGRPCIVHSNLLML